MVFEAIAEAKQALAANASKPPKPPTPCNHAIDLALVVPDIRLYQLLKQKAIIVQPAYDPVTVSLHVLVADTKDPLHDLGWDIRVALAQLGLVLPEDVHLSYPDQVTLGWPEQEKP